MRHDIPEKFMKLFERATSAALDPAGLTNLELLDLHAPASGSGVASHMRGDPRMADMWAFLASQAHREILARLIGRK